MSVAKTVTLRPVGVALTAAIASSGVATEIHGRIGPR